MDEIVGPPKLQESRLLTPDEFTQPRARTLAQPPALYVHTEKKKMSNSTFFAHRVIAVWLVARIGVELQRVEGLFLAFVRHGDLRLGLEVVIDVVGREAVARAPQEVVPALRSAVRAPAAAH